MTRNCLGVLLVLGLGVPSLSAQGEHQKNLFSWRGPFQTGVSPETYEKLSFEGEKSLAWTYPLSGRGCPVVVDGKLYAFGYSGEGADLQISLTCLDATSGDKVWEHRFNDFISDTIYSRYGTGSPVVDPETRNVYLLTSTGLFSAFSKDGELLWQHSMMESFGRLTFPNGRTGAPVIDGDLVIARGITSSWGNQGPARDRFYAFDKVTGQPVWSSEPGTEPKDSSFSTPVFEDRDGKRVFYVGTGCGNIVCINARTGQPLWRFSLAKGGVNSTLSIHPSGRLICIHGQENWDTSEEGRMIALELPEKLIGPGEEQVVLDEKVEIWRNNLIAFTSSPTLVDDRAYVLDKTGNLCCVDVTNGKVLWQEKLDSDNLHSSPLYVDGLLYTPTNNGKFFVIRPSDSGPEILHTLELEGNCLGMPAAWSGHLYVHTTAKLYCFKLTDGAVNYTDVPEKAVPYVAEAEMGEPEMLIVLPNEFVLTAGASVPLKAYKADATGVRGEAAKDASFSKFVPPTAKVKTELDGTIDGSKIGTSDDALTSAGMIKASADSLSGTARGRLFASLPLTEDFEGYELAEDHATEGVKFAYPPLPWIGGRFKWEIRDLDGNKVLAKTLDRVLFQRATTFIGGEDMSNYTFQADVMTDGLRRGRNEGDIGLINQRYLIALKGGWDIIEVSSNHERIKESVPFPVERNTWYTIKTRVDVAPDGSGVVRGKAWIKGEPEPEAWTIEVKHNHANTHGSPGIFGFSPQSQKRVYVDNLELTQNQ